MGMAVAETLSTRCGTGSYRKPYLPLHSSYPHWSPANCLAVDSTTRHPGASGPPLAFKPSLLKEKGLLSCTPALLRTASYGVASVFVGSATSRFSHCQACAGLWQI